MIDKFKETFREEAVELLNNLENSLLELETDPTNKEEIASVFRTMHTIKGSSAMFGFQHISGFTHRIENLMEYLREGKIRATKEFINLTLDARDHIRVLLETAEPIDKAVANTSEDILRRFDTLVNKLLGKPVSEAEVKTGEPEPEKVEAVLQPSQATSAAKEAKQKVVYRVLFKPAPEISKNGTNVMLLLDELAGLGDFTCLAHVDGIPDLESLDPESLQIGWEILLDDERGRECDPRRFHFRRIHGEDRYLPRRRPKRSGGRGKDPTRKNPHGNAASSIKIPSKPR